MLFTLGPFLLLGADTVRAAVLAFSKASLELNAVLNMNRRFWIGLLFAPSGWFSGAFLVAAESPPSRGFAESSIFTGNPLRFPVTRALQGNPPRLSSDQIAAYVRLHPNDPDACLAAVRLSHDLDLLQKSALQFPQHAALQLELFRRSELAAVRENALRAFRKADPQNILGAYLSALQWVKSGNPQEAVSELVNSGKSPFFSGYNEHGLDQTAEVFRLAGFSEAVAWGAAFIGRADTGTDEWSIFDMFSELAEFFQHTGDEQGAIVMRGMQLEFVRHLQHTLGVLEQVVGLKMELRLGAEFSVPIGAQVTLRRDEIITLVSRRDQWIQTATEEEVIHYLALVKQVGELETMRSTFR